MGNRQLTSFEGLRGSSVRNLNATNVGVRNIEPLLGLYLDSFDLDTLNAYDIERLCTIKTLRDFNICGDTVIPNLKPFVGLPRLRTLTLANCYILSLEGAGALDTLEYLLLWLSDVDDVEPIFDIPQLRNITVSPWLAEKIFAHSPEPSFEVDVVYME
jgi:Leucine-rich repeat (LRR) protein